ncbi:MAG: PAS domain-containing protein [Raineya sp.]
MLSSVIRPVQYFFEQVYQPILIADNEGKILYANPASLQLFNSTSVEMQGKKLEDYLQIPYTNIETEKRVVVIKQNGEKQSADMIESPIDYEGGIYRMILLKPVEVGFVSAEDKIKLLLKTIHKDISRREEEIEKLSNEIEARTKILNAAAIVSETDQYGTITFVNDTFCKVAKYSPEELLGKPHNIVRHPDMPKAVFKEMWDTIKRGEIFQGIVKNRAKDGSPYWVIATIGGVLGADGKPYKYIGVRIDITPLIKRGLQVDIM